ncbi:MAG: hypothetical protein HY851_07750, partial [candidate division Zixibacteria bacterium]|nr:hypothetical protein [candidate division Zixibacteria bacterium]
LYYYGFPFPNTYYAKTHTGIPSGEILQQGFLYFLDSLRINPITLLTIFIGLASAFVIRSARVIAVAFGIALFFIYTLRVGGDFMSGRFFTAPLVCAVALLTQLPISLTGWRSLIPITLVLVIGLSSPKAPIFSTELYGTAGENEINPFGIADERGWYYQGTGLMLMKRGTVYPDHYWSHKGLEARDRGTGVIYDRSVGFMGYWAGPAIHIVDMFGLTDPLLSRLPEENPKVWRIGHFVRTSPAGYESTLLIDSNVVDDPNLHAYVDRLRILSRGRLWSTERLKTIITFNTGQYESLLQAYAFPPPVDVTYNEADHRKARNTAWDAPGVFKLNKNGLVVILPDVSHAANVEISFDHNDNYLITFTRGKREVGYLAVEREFIDQGGLRIDTLHLAAETYLAGYDRVKIHGYGGDDRYAVGHVSLLEDGP